MYKAAGNSDKVDLCLSMMSILTDLGSMTGILTIPAPEGAKDYALCPSRIRERKPRVFISTGAQGAASLKDLTELIAAYDGTETASITVG